MFCCPDPYAAPVQGPDPDPAPDPGTALDCVWNDPK